MLLNRKRGAILIISLWIATILVLFCLSIAYRVNLGLKLTKLYRDKLKAKAIAEGALLRIIQEKIEKDENPNADYFSESWSNKVYEEGEEKEGLPYFQDFPLGEGTFTISYNFRESIDAGELVTFYGMRDEQSEFNINTITAAASDRKNQFTALVGQIKSEADPVGLVDSLIKWKIDHGGTINSLEELERIPGFTRELLYTYDKNEDGSITSDEIGLLEYATIYGNKEGKINVNTTNKEVLLALGFNAEQVDYIFQERLGDDKLFKTEDDGIKNISALKDELKALYPSIPIPSGIDYLDVKSSIYRAKIFSQVRNVKKNLEVVLEIKDGKYNALYWHE